VNLEEYHNKIGKHLHLIEAGAEMAARHARMMVQKPSFDTIAQDEMERAERVLEAALLSVRNAKSVYAAKPMEISNVA
jgi:hypothetical protein